MKRDEPMELKNLLPCPFCGSQAKLNKNSSDGKNDTHACCSFEGCKMFNLYFPISHWQTRQPTGIELQPLDKEKLRYILLDRSPIGIKVHEDVELAVERICQELGTPKERLVRWPEKRKENKDSVPQNAINLAFNMARDACIKAAEQAGIKSMAQ